MRIKRDRSYNSVTRVSLSSSAAYDSSATRDYSEPRLPSDALRGRGKTMNPYEPPSGIDESAGNDSNQETRDDSRAERLLFVGLVVAVILGFIFQFMS